MALQLLPCAVGSQLSHGEDNEAALWRGPHGEWDLWTTASKNLPAMRVLVEVVSSLKQDFWVWPTLPPNHKLIKNLKQTILRKPLANS